MTLPFSSRWWLRLNHDTSGDGADSCTYKLSDALVVSKA